LGSTSRTAALWLSAGKNGRGTLPVKPTAPQDDRRRPLCTYEGREAV
jgi:hypothetical protein